MILLDTERPVFFPFSSAELKAAVTVVAWDGNRFAWQDEDFADWSLEPDDPPGPWLFDRIMAATR